MPSPVLSSQLFEAVNQPDLEVLILPAQGERRQCCRHRLPAVQLPDACGDPAGRAGQGRQQRGNKAVHTQH